MGPVPEDFRLQEDYFEHRSAIHGMHHTYRVLCHCRLLGDILKLERETLLAQCAAFIHDMSRRHDGTCPQHGAWAAREKLPRFEGLFLSLGVRPEEMPRISAAVSNHSEPAELDREDPCYFTAAVLKDADALDRVRLGEGNLDVACLRFPESRALIPFSRQLYYRTREIADLTPEGINGIARGLLRLTM